MYIFTVTIVIVFIDYIMKLVKYKKIFTALFMKIDTFRFV